jgi:membrane associated rhomboid family serine protease
MAHIGGFVFGLVVAAVLRKTDWWRRGPAPAYRLAP